MKIYPTQQSFQSKTKIIKPSKKVVDRLTIGTCTMLATIMLGSAYMVRDRDYYESRKAITENQIFNLRPNEIDAIVERLNVENLNIKPQKENGKFSYEAKIGHFKTLSGEFYKENPHKEIIHGTYKEKGLFKEKNYNFTLEHPFSNNRYKINWFILKCAPEETPEKVEKYNIYQNEETEQVYINGVELSTQEARDSKHFGLAILILALANIYFLTSSKKESE